MKAYLYKPKMKWIWEDQDRDFNETLNTSIQMKENIW